MRRARSDMNLQRNLVVATTVGVLVMAAGLEGQAQEIGRGYSGPDWPFVGGDWSSSRYSTLTDITTDNVGRLGGAWVTRLEGGGRRDRHQ